MARSALLTFLMCVFLMHRGSRCLEPENKGSLYSEALDLPWQDELCCDSLLASHGGKEKDTKKLSESNLTRRLRCLLRGSANENHPSEDAGGTCMDILCRVDEGWVNFTCDLQRSHGHSSSRLDAGLMVVQLHRLLSQEADSEVDYNPVVCEAQDSFMCSFTIGTNRSFVTVVTVSLSDAAAPSVQLRIPAKPVKPSPPVHLSHIQTIEGELILQWDEPPDVSGPFRYEVRQAFNSTHADWKMSALLEPRLPLDLMHKVNYSVQVRCSQRVEPPLWSEWSEPHHIYLHVVSYIPEKVVVRPGENVTVYCVLNDHSTNASTALWRLNFLEPLHHSHPVSQWVSQITVHPSENRLYDVLQCTQNWSIPYSQIYVQGAFINISCETSGDIDAMECRWTNTQWTTPIFRSKWADMTCDEMEEKERVGEEVGALGPACTPFSSTCKIQPLRMNCYKLWLEVPSQLGPIRSKPVYLSPIDHVKPHPPTNVRAVSQSSRVLNITWEPPSLPAEGLQCQIRYCLSSNMKAQPDWGVLEPVWIHRVEVVVPNMCKVYVVQVQCRRTTGMRYWSNWSHAVDSKPQNGRVPERGPDFWRIQRENVFGKSTNITLLFEHFSIPGCVDGFVVQRQTADRSVIREQISAEAASYSFEWDQEPITVTVEAYNSKGSSTNNINMTLEKQPKYRSVRSFHVSLINSSCVSVSWSLWSNSSKPLFMVVQWVPQRTQKEEEEGVSEPRGKTWSRLPYTEQTVYLRGDFFGTGDFGFYLYAVFADGEAEPVYTLATRRDPAVYLMLLIVSFLSIALFVTAVFTQNQVKRFVWRDVPNPRMCSWAKGEDFKKADTFHHLVRAPEGLPVWPLLLPPEKISKVIIMDQIKTTRRSSVVCLTPDHATDGPISVSQFGPEVVHFEALSSIAMVTEKEVVLPVQQCQSGAESSAQSSVTYATVQHSDPKHQEEGIHLHDKEGSGSSGSSSSDEGNFSANSDISGSFPSGLWELYTVDPRRSCSYNSVEELSETSEHENGNELYYLGMDFPAEDEQSEEDEEQPTGITLKTSSLSREGSVESHPLLGPQVSSEPTLLYLPQFRTVPHKTQLSAAHRQDHAQL
ncbi:leptin receptor isoform X2 [Gouania willdenowi]|uniref:Fibronectin type-III domain-containing protein n=1 Tax=Gouania willdenowi TaxID=441366 RepID=A0A8C5G5E8_GOUWI|nr:leptin receptor isoform X2 [Gouania willdenowi]